MLPGIGGAESGAVPADELFVAEGAPRFRRTRGAALASPLAGSLVFMIGCHAGGNLPTAYYGARGGLGRRVLGRRRLRRQHRLRAREQRHDGARRAAARPVLRTGSASRSADDRTRCPRGALMYAKQSYLGGRGLYSGLRREGADGDRVLRAADVHVHAGRRRRREGHAAARGAGRPDARDGGGGRAARASLSLAPASFDLTTRTDDQGREVSYLTADGGEPLVVPGQPILPKVVSQLAAAPAGLVARGALITGSARRSSSRTSRSSGDRAAERGHRRDRRRSRRGRVPVDLRHDHQAGDADRPRRPARDDPGTRRIGRRRHGRHRAVHDDGHRRGLRSCVLDRRRRPDDQHGGRAAAREPHVRGRRRRHHRGGRRRAQRRPPGAAPRPARGRGAVAVLPPRPVSEGLRRRRHAEPRWIGDVDFDGPARWIVQVVDAAGNVAIETARGHLDVAGPPRPRSREARTRACSSATACCAKCSSTTRSRANG